jgi:hypothetical protein
LDQIVNSRKKSKQFDRFTWKKSFQWLLAQVRSHLLRDSLIVERIAIAEDGSILARL